MINKIYTIREFIEALDNSGLLMGTDMWDYIGRTRSARQKLR